MMYQAYASSILVSVIICLALPAAAEGHPEINGRWIRVNSDWITSVECPDVIEFHQDSTYTVFNDCYGVSSQNPIVESGDWNYVPSANSLSLSNRSARPGYIFVSGHPDLTVTLQWVDHDQVLFRFVAGADSVERYVRSSAPERMPSFVDLSVGEIEIGSTDQRTKLDGVFENCWELKDAFRATCFVNAKGTEQLTLFANPGSIQGSFSLIRIEARVSTSDDFPIHAKHGDHFITGKGIHLGMTLDSVIHVLGEPHETDAGTIRYRVVNNDAVMKQFNTPIYAGTYRFKDGILVAMEFGFEYP